VVTHLLTQKPVILLFVVLAVGTAFGLVRVKRVSIGAAAVLFTALAFSAVDPKLALPEVMGTLGLAIFAYCVGVTAGGSFFASLRRGLKPLLIVLLGLTGCAAIAAGVGRALGLDAGTAAGVFAGATTNTPALAAAVERLDGAASPTVGYSISYLGGVLIMLSTAMVALRRKEPPAAASDAPGSVTNLTIRVTRGDLPPLGELEQTSHGQVLFSRVKHGGSVSLASDDLVPQPGDRVVAIGSPEALDDLTRRLGKVSTLPLHLERTAIDYRRIMLSARRHFGRTVAQLELGPRFGATATRVRRVDQDLLAEDDLVLQEGDRIRVAAPQGRMGEVAKYLGDSEHAASDINPLGFSTGLAIGLVLGALPIPVPGLGQFELGSAAGPLLVGLVLGRLGRTGPVVWSLPHQASETMNHLGLLIFLAYAGGRAGSAFVEAVRSPLGLKVLLLGLVVTTFHAVVLLALAGRLAGMSGPRLAGMIAGAQTQPAVLGYANDRTKHDQRVTLGYVLVYPLAMVVKIILAQVLAAL
jgi:putative transport protein